MIDINKNFKIILKSDFFPPLSTKQVSICQDCNVFNWCYCFHLLSFNLLLLIIGIYLQLYFFLLSSGIKKYKNTCFTLDFKSTCCQKKKKKKITSFLKFTCHFIKPGTNLFLANFTYTFVPSEKENIFVINKKKNYLNFSIKKITI